MLTGFNPGKARPEELKFDIFDGNQRTIGQLVCQKFEMRLRSSKFIMSTPWGDARIEYSKGGSRIFIKERELLQLKLYGLNGRVDLAFPNGTVMQFDRVKGKRNDIVYSGDDGRVGFFEEKGTLPEGARARPLTMTREEIKALPKEDRPHSVETDDYVQYRIVVGGTLPVREDDVVRGLCVFASFGRLIDEIPSG